VSASQLLAATVSVLLLQCILKQVVLLPLGPAGAKVDRGKQHGVSKTSSAARRNAMSNLVTTAE
jgi:hypothetical protein